MFGSLPVRARLVLPLAAAVSMAVASASDAIGADCKGGLCLVLENINNPKYVHFHFTTTAFPFTHFNMIHRGIQRQLARKGSSASVVTYVPRRANDSVRVQVCNRGALSATSSCLPWRSFALPEPAAAKPDEPKKNKGQWAAIAADGKGRWGYGTKFDSADGARKAALAGCGSGCKVEISAQNRCIAYAESKAGGYWYGASIGRTQNAVTAAARNACAAGAPKGSCKVVRVLCG
jgi:hypothetical protein